MMKINKKWAFGIDIGGTKIEISAVDETGFVHKKLKLATNIQGGPSAVIADLVSAIQSLQKEIDSPPIAIGIGIAAQVNTTGLVNFAPNLYWRNVSLKTDLEKILLIPVIVINDVRAATWGEWKYGAGKDCQELICLFVGTGIGGGIISGGNLITGNNNSAGELGHITINFLGNNLCTCGNKGCLESYAGGWAIAKEIQKKVQLNANTKDANSLLSLTQNRIESLNAKHVFQAANEGNSLAVLMIEEISQALISGATTIVNAFNPQKLILGGGIILGMPSLVNTIRDGVEKRALQTAIQFLEIQTASLLNSAGAIGAASFAMHSVLKNKTNSINKYELKKN